MGSLLQEMKTGKFSDSDSDPRVLGDPPPLHAVDTRGLWDGGWRDGSRQDVVSGKRRRSRRIDDNGTCGLVHSLGSWSSFGQGSYTAGGGGGGLVSGYEETGLTGASTALGSR